jgi:LemA protein
MFIAIAAVLGVLLLYVVYIYNSLIKKKNLVDESWSGIDVQLKRRYDLIPNLVETVKGYASHEKETLANVVELRNAAMSAEGDLEKRAEKENQLSQTLKSIFALAEAYPELKANQNFQQLQTELTEIEDAIQNSRRYYNATVREYNVAIETFPTVIFANMLGFQKRDYFEAAEEERENVKVDFGSEE